MATITKHDLQFKYKWTSESPRFNGVPDSYFVDRNEGHEVLYYLNALSRDKRSIETALKAERLIKQHMPGSIQTAKNITKWLKDNWDKY